MKLSLIFAGKGKPVNMASKVNGVSESPQIKPRDLKTKVLKSVGDIDAVKEKAQDIRPMIDDFPAEKSIWERKFEIWLP